MSDARVGVLLIGGFLGAGKTTLLSRLVRDPEVGGRIAVLVNELGALGIDGELIAQAREGGAVRTVQLDSGCLCCTLTGELGEALHELARPKQGPPPQQIIVELSGAALASEVHFQIATQALEAPYFVDGLVCVVDAQAAPRWANEAEALFVDQLSRADLVLLSKLDVCSPQQKQDTLALIAKLAPGARVVEAVRGEVDPALLLGGFQRADAAPRTAATPHVHALDGETLRLTHALAHDELMQLLEAVTPDLFRVKGLVDLYENEPRSAIATVVQCVGDQIELTRAAPTLEKSERRLIFIGPGGAPASAIAQARAALVARARSS